MSGEKPTFEAHPTAAPVPAVPPVPHVLSVLSVPSSASPLMTISRKRNRPHPPNCTVCDSNPSRFLAFRRTQNEVEAEYGFRLGVPRRTDAERDGYCRYMRDWRRRYGEAHREARKAYRHAYWLNVTKRGFDSLAEANGDEAALKRRAEKKAAKQKRADYEERKRQVYEQYGSGSSARSMASRSARPRSRRRRSRASSVGSATRRRTTASVITTRSPPTTATTAAASAPRRSPRSRPPGRPRSGRRGGSARRTRRVRPARRRGWCARS